MADQTTAPPKPSSSVKLVLLGEAAVGKVSADMLFLARGFGATSKGQMLMVVVNGNSHH